MRPLRHIWRDDDGHGFDTFLLWTKGEEQLQRFAEEVAPAVRAQVTRERGSRPGQVGWPNALS